MLEWPKYSVYDSSPYLELRNSIKNPGPGRPKAWAYPWCILEGRLEENLVSLDYGCGAWTNFTYYISSITKSMTIGMDLGNLQPDVGQVRFVRNSLESIQFPDNFFDRIFSVSVLEHVPLAERDRVWRELFRVLRPGGLAVITIDWIFNMNERLLAQLENSEYLGRIGSQIYGNFDFSAIVSDYAHVVSPLVPIDERYLPGSPQFDEARIMENRDILISESDNVTDTDLFKYTTVGLILKKKSEAGDGG